MLNKKQNNPHLRTVRKPAHRSSVHTQPHRMQSFDAVLSSMPQSFAPELQDVSPDTLKTESAMQKDSPV